MYDKVNNQQAKNFLVIKLIVKIKLESKKEEY